MLSDYVGIDIPDNFTQLLDPTSGDGTEAAITSPRGGRLHRFAADGRFLGALARADICGLAASGAGYLASDGLGGLIALARGAARPLGRADRAWDNHIVAL